MKKTGSTAPLKKGDLVRHQSGGPVMLVSVVTRDLVYCVWFSEIAKMCSGTFLSEMLVNVDKEKRSPVVPA